MKKSLLVVLLLAIQIFTYGQSQTFLSEYWTGSGGEMGVFHRNVTKTDSLSNVYVAGSTLDTNNSNDIIVQKFNPQGTLLWQQTFNGAANMDDMAADIFIDNSLNVYVTGTSIANATDSFDLVVLKYSSLGILQWNYYYDNGGSPYPYDAGTAIIGDNSGAIYVAGSSFGTSSMADYVTLKIDASTGTQTWVSRYDFIQLNDVASQIKVDGSIVLVTGGSQGSTNPDNWKLTTLRYDATTGTLLLQRTSGGNSTTGVDEVYDLTLDGLGYIYVTGAVMNLTTNYDMVIYKLDSNLNIIWERQYDPYGNDDKGHGVKVDSQGSVYVAGFVTSDSEGKNYSLLKYNSAGVLQWWREFNGLASADDEAVHLVVDGFDRVFVTGTAQNGANRDYQTVGYLSDGKLFTQISYDGTDGLDDKPNAITIDLDGNLIVVGQEKTSGGKYKNTTIKYSVNEKPIVPVYIDSVPSHNKGELIIRFDRSAIKFPAIDKKKFEAGLLNDFVKTAAITEMSTKLGMDVSRFPTFKIFRRMTTADTISITRLGDTVRVDDFWATLSVFLPDSMDEQNAADSLSMLTDIIWYAERDYFGELTAVPDDPLYFQGYPAGQTGLRDPGFGINVQNAWDKQVGRSYVKVGVFDSGINWRHEDFGDGTWASTKIAGGWDFVNNVHPSSQADPDVIGHGTATSGIIGALRNNGKGTAGIAGGDVQTGNTGVQIFSLKISDENDSYNTVFAAHSVIASAIVEGSVSSPFGYGYGLHIQNHSWVSNNNTAMLREAVHTCNQNACAFVAASGNFGFGESCPAYSPDCPLYPASYTDNWVMKVGASNSTGNRASDFSVYGNNLDFIAPGTSDIFNTLSNFGVDNYTFTDFGTSFAAPHVSGVAALMYSQHNPTNGAYYPNVLAPEDIEILLKKSATEVFEDLSEPDETLPVPNQYAGHGRINAAASLDKVSPPYRVRHFSQKLSTSSATLVAANQNIVFPEGLPIGPPLHIGTSDIYELTATLAHTLPAGETYFSGWVRNSASLLAGFTNTLYYPQWSGVTLDASDQTNATLTGYLYKTRILDANNQVINEMWFPSGLNSFATFAYSIHTVAPDLSVSDNELTAWTVSLFPNPAQDVLNLSFNMPPGGVEINLYDMAGRYLTQYRFDSPEKGEQYKTIDISGLAKGIYACRFTFGDRQIVRKFIKN